jgi:threonine dehydrogenase-like Zn-dependent dehydrogenase
MIVDALQTDGKGNFFETTYNVQPPGETEIQVAAVMTGICRSDVDMMQGKFALLPSNMHGHEGLGQIIEIGNKVTDVKVGDLVATRGEPAYADVYNVRAKEYVKVPEAEPKYILEPVACGINIIHQPIREIAERSGPGKRLLIIGSGFLAWVAYHTIKLNHLDFEITVKGKSNKRQWGELLSEEYTGTFDVIIDLGSGTDVFDQPIVNNEALIVFGNQKQVNTDFGNLLWKACTIMFPSPRTEGFYKCMQDAATWIENGDINVDRFWSNAYTRVSQWEQAFEESINRKANQSRGYLLW